MNSRAKSSFFIACLGALLLGPAGKGRTDPDSLHHDSKGNAPGHMVSLESGDSVTGDKEKKPCREAEPVNWQGYDQAVEKADKQGIPILLVFYDDNCRKCEMLEEKGFNRPDLACFINQNLSAARLRGKSNPELKTRYRVSSYPTVWFLTPEGREIDFFVGYVKPEKLSVILHFIGEQAYKSMTFAEYEKTHGE